MGIVCRVIYNIILIIDNAHPSGLGAAVTVCTAICGVHQCVDKQRRLFNQLLYKHLDDVHRVNVTTFMVLKYSTLVDRSNGGFSV